MTAVAPTDNKKAIAVFKRSATKLQKQAAELVISNDDQLNNAAALLGTIKAEQKDLKVQKKKITDPIKQALDEVKALFAEPEGILADIESLLKQGMLDYHNQKDAEAQKQIDGINRRVNKGTMRVDTAMAKLANIDQAESSVQTATGGANFKLGPKKLRIMDPAALLKARPDLLLRERVLEALRLELSAELKENEDVATTPGIEVYREKTVAGISA